MFEDILFIDVLNKNGLTYFNDNEDELDSISTDANMELAFLEDYNSINEIIEYIENTDHDAIIFKFEKSKGLLVDKLTSEILKITDKRVIWFCEQLKKSCYIEIENKNVPIFNSTAKLNEYLSNISLKLGSIEKEKIHNLFLNHNEYPGLYKTAMSNGYFAYETGVYNFLDADMSLKHIKTDNSIDLPSVLDNLDVNINSAFFIETNAYDHNIYSKANDMDKFVSHLHQITKDTIYLDNSKKTIKSERCSFLEYVNLCKADKLDENKIYVTSLSSPEDINAFKEELNEFGKTGKMLPPQFYLQDECRWIGKCSINMSKRLNIVNEKLKTCNDTDESIYDLYDDNFTRLAKINRKKSQSEIQRKCSDCKYKKSCSKCICLPRNMTEESFCKLVNDYPYVTEYVYKKNFKLLLLMSSAKFMKKINDIQISSQVCPILYEEKTKEYDTSKMIYLFRLKNQFFMYNLKNNQIIKVDEKLAFILEGYSQSRQMQDIILNFKEKYGIDDICAKNTVEQGIFMLKNMGIKV